MNYRIIASGSKGNALAICEGSIKILIDCGVSYKSVKGLRPDFIFLTHEHSDHLRVRTIKNVMKNHPLCKFVIAPFLYQKLRDADVPARRIIVCDAGETVVLKKGNAFVSASTFSLVHDVPNVGWRLSLVSNKASGKTSKSINTFGDSSVNATETTIMYATDTCKIDHIELKNLDYYFIEANYVESELEERMQAKLEAGEYAYEMRVKGSHLSQEQTDKWLSDNAGESSKFIYMHQHIENKNGFAGDKFKEDMGK